MNSSFNHLRKVSVLTPAAFANSDLVIALILIKSFSVLHLERFRIEFAINPVMFAVLGYKQLRIVRQTHIRPVIVERSRIAMGDGEIRIFLNLNPLLPLPDERRVYLPLLL